MQSDAQKSHAHTRKYTLQMSHMGCMLVPPVLARNIETVIHLVPSLHVTITFKSDALAPTVNQNKVSCFGAPFAGGAI